jgi:hypothetical protein
VAWRVIFKFFNERNAMESGVGLAFTLHYENLLRLWNLRCRPMPLVEI